MTNFLSHLFKDIAGFVKVVKFGEISIVNVAGDRNAVLCIEVRVNNAPAMHGR